MNPELNRKVVITGAAGEIGSLAVRRLAATWQIRATDIRQSSDVERLDVTDGEACAAAFKGADAVVHLAADPNPEASWDELRQPNIEGTYAVSAAARDACVRRLVLASSLQAVAAYPPDRQRRANDPPRPSNLYGATKAWAEAVGSWVAATSSTSVVALRIGYFGQRPPSGDEATPRNLAAWLSPNDCVRLIQSAVESDFPTGFIVVNGISKNRHRIAELGEVEDLIGYRPTDDAWLCDRSDRVKPSHS